MSTARPNIVFVDCEPSVVADWSSLEPLRMVGGVNSATTNWDVCQDATLALVDVTPSGRLRLEAVRRLKATVPKLPIVAVTHYPSIDLAVKVVQSGAAYCLTQPIYLDELLRLASSEGSDHTRHSVVENFRLPTLGRVEWEYIARVLSHARGNISVAARILGIRRSTLQRKLKKYPHCTNEDSPFSLRRAAARPQYIGPNGENPVGRRSPDQLAGGR